MFSNHQKVLGVYVSYSVHEVSWSFNQLVFIALQLADFKSLFSCFGNTRMVFHIQPPPPPTSIPNSVVYVV